MRVGVRVSAGGARGVVEAVDVAESQRQRRVIVANETPAIREGKHERMEKTKRQIQFRVPNHKKQNNKLNKQS